MALVRARVQADMVPPLPPSQDMAPQKNLGLGAPALALGMIMRTTAMQGGMDRRAVMEEGMDKIAAMEGGMERKAGLVALVGSEGLGEVPSGRMALGGRDSHWILRSLRHLPSIPVGLEEQGEALEREGEVEGADLEEEEAGEDVKKSSWILMSLWVTL